jgi:tellurite resistance protein TerC
MEVDFWVWPAFLGLVTFLLLLDLLVFHREAHEVSLSESFVWSIVWTVIGLGFAAVVWAAWGADSAGEYVAGYVIERSLSVDNIFVFALIFGYFSVPAAYQHRILVWGVIGAIILRGIFIALGAGLLESFHWMTYVFGIFLVFTGVRMALGKEMEVRPEDNPAVKLMRRFLPVTTQYRGIRLFIRDSGILMATPLLAVAVTIATTDVVFAIDSIPAIFAVTEDTFIVFSSNAMAVLGMRVLYFMLAGAMHRFVYLKAGLSLVLVFVGTKMLTTNVYRMPTAVSLGVIALLLAGAMTFSLVATRNIETEVSEPEALVEYEVVEESTKRSGV